MKRAPALLLLPLFLPRLLAAQGVLIAPTSIFMDSRTRTATVLLVNPNDQAVEVTLSTTYGYAVTDSTGHFQPWFTDTPDSTAPDAAPWVRIFPRRASLEPRAQQVVRLLISPPAGLADGEYWARLVVLAKGGQLQVSAPADSNAVSIGLPMQVRTILPLLYRNGKVQTGAEVDRLSAATEGDSLVLRARISRIGNAALLATARGTLTDSAGVLRAHFSLPVSVYAPIEPRFVVPLDSLPRGPYVLRMEVTPGRTDLPAEALLPFRVARDSLSLQVP
jgi:P pilus assembly chaperone PapD